MKARLFVVVLLAAAAVAAWLLWPRPAGEADGFTLQGLLGGQAEGYARAEAVRPFAFPADHGPHPDYRSEWWYLTGNLFTPEGRRFGFQFTVFRFALAPQPRGGQSAWATRQAYMAHFTLTDLASGRFHAFERFSRGGAGLAGAQADPFRVWLEDWALAGRGDPWPWQLRAAAEQVGLALRLAPAQPPVLQGQEGLSRKGPERGNASYYYSYPRLQATGEVRLVGERLPVKGSVWLDREWSTSALSPELAGWDWFALQFEDGGELMIYQLRGEQGGSSPFSAGTYVPPQGPPRRLTAREFELEALESWTSPNTGVSYPARWRLRIPDLAADLEVRAALADQELDLAVRYWEGAVDVSGKLQGRQAEGVGYMELTGYGGGAAVRAE